MLRRLCLVCEAWRAGCLAGTIGPQLQLIRVAVCLVALVFALGTLAWSGAACAASGTWITDCSGLWSDDANWSGGVVAYDMGNAADFSTVDITADRMVSLDTALTIGNLIFGDADTKSPAGWTLGGTNTLTLAGSAGTEITVNAFGDTKGVTISAPLKLITNAIYGATVYNKINVLSGGTLSLAGKVTNSGGTNRYTRLEKRGAGVLNVTGQLFDPTDANLRIIKIHAGVLNLASTNVYATGLNIVDANATAINTGITLDPHGSFTLGYSTNATACYDMRGGSLTVISNGIYTAWDGDGGTKAIVTLDNNACVELKRSASELSGSEFLMGGTGARNGSTTVVIRNGSINFTTDDIWVVGHVDGRNVLEQLDGTVNCPRDQPTPKGGVPGALTLQYRMGNVDNFGIYNLNGGTLTAGAIVSGDGTTDFAKNNAYVNFHGGTLSPAGNEGNFVRTTLTGTSASIAAPQLMVYSEGAVIDTAGYDITIQQKLAAPPGRGVAGGTLLIDAVDQGSGYKATPIINVTRASSDTTGVAATAIANMVDDGSGNGTLKIASITITNPGVNYTAVPTLTISGGDPTAQAVLPALSIANNVSGGLTKKGGGTLTLSAVNTYTGGTIVDGGTLQIEKAGALPAGYSLTINAGGTVGLFAGLTVASAGNAATSTATVPEPGTVALLIAGALASAAWAPRLSASRCGRRANVQQSLERVAVSAGGGSESARALP